MWLFVSLLMSYLSGWQGLAKRYRATGDFDGPVWHRQSGQFGMVGLRNVLHLGANHQGLSLSMMILFRFGYAPLFIPWSDIVASPKKKWFLHGMQYRLGGPTGPTLWVRADLAERVRQASAG